MPRILTPTSCAPWWARTPPTLPADTTAKRVADRLLPKGAAACAFFTAVAVLLSVAHQFPTTAGLTAEGVAALAAGTWCTVNFWRCRHAHCLITGPGWVGLSLLSFAGAAAGHSLITGYENAAFLGILAVGALFEAGWYLARRR